MKERFRCGSCNWKFLQHKQPKLCPYCGKDSVSIDQTKTADQLLHELEF